MTSYEELINQSLNNVNTLNDKIKRLDVLHDDIKKLQIDNENTSLDYAHKVSEIVALTDKFVAAIKELTQNYLDSSNNTITKSLASLHGINEDFLKILDTFQDQLGKHSKTLNDSTVKLANYIDKYSSLDMLANVNENRKLLLNVQTLQQNLSKGINSLSNGMNNLSNGISNLSNGQNNIVFKLDDNSSKIIELIADGIDNANASFSRVIQDLGNISQDLHGMFNEYGQEHKQLLLNILTMTSDLAKTFQHVASILESRFAKIETSIASLEFEGFSNEISDKITKFENSVIASLSDIRKQIGVLSEHDREADAKLSQMRIFLLAGFVVLLLFIVYFGWMSMPTAPEQVPLATQ
jgi:hypothetical protein